MVECDLERPETIAPALGSAARVVCAVGASETDLSGPRRIDGAGAAALVEAANAAGVAQFVLVTSLGTGKVGFPAGVLNLFGGVLIFKRKAEEALEASGMPYVIVRPGGMEAPRDDHKLTHNVRLATRDKLFGGTVSRLQARTRGRLSGLGEGGDGGAGIRQAPGQGQRPAPAGPSTNPPRPPPAPRLPPASAGGRAGGGGRGQP